MATLPLPEGYLRIRSPPITLVCRTDLAVPLERAGLLCPAEPESWAARVAGYHQGRGRSVVLEFDGLPEGCVVVKRMQHGGWFGKLRGSLFARPARVMSELRVVEHLRRRGVRTPAMVFVRIRDVAGPACRVWVGTEEVAGAQDLGAWLRPAPERSHSVRGRVLEGVGRLVAAIHDAGVHHADLNLRNLLVRETEPEAPFVIDLDQSCIEVPLAHRRRIQNLERLWRSVVKSGLGQRGEAIRWALRFLRGYSGSAYRETWCDVLALWRRTSWRHRLAWWLTRSVGRA
ncbi:MAG: lipopolysaccharide kinase InaA family protein [Planctomycetota bacterium]